MPMRQIEYRGRWFTVWVDSVAHTARFQIEGRPVRQQAQPKPTFSDEDLFAEAGRYARHEIDNLLSADSNHRQETGMTKPVLNEEQYVAKMNDLLQKQDYYRQGMAVVLVPPESRGETASGYDGVGGLEPGHLAGLAKAVNAEYELEVTRK